MFDAHPPLMRALLRALAVHLRRLVNLADMLALHSVQGRIAGVLLEQAEAAARGEAMKPSPRLRWPCGSAQCGRRWTCEGSR